MSGQTGDGKDGDKGDTFPYDYPSTSTSYRSLYTIPSISKGPFVRSIGPNTLRQGNVHGVPHYSDFIPSIPYVANRFDDTIIWNMCAEHCRFTHHDAYNALGLFYEKESQIAIKDIFNPLGEWEEEHI
uniref:OSJNBa0071G03.6 protein n=1 Tax=Oryza sativa subsp. japonica TaxID=39947 RepID=Q7XX23_ORYSJ|nr:OSJNBa0071G03.6 [Oryza sativa Japonica Group]